MKKFLFVLSALALAASAGSVMADNPNWSAERAAEIDANRNSDAGIGNGGERVNAGNWSSTSRGEDGGLDVDPGNSGGNNQACTGGTPGETSC